MASIIKQTINLESIPKNKIYKGKKGQYITIVTTLNNELDNYGNNGPVIVEQSKEERDNGEQKIYLGNAKVVWTDGNNVDKAEYTQATPQVRPGSPDLEDDLPF